MNVQVKGGGNGDYQQAVVDAYLPIGDSYAVTGNVPVRNNDYEGLVFGSPELGARYKNDMFELGASYKNRSNVDRGYFRPPVKEKRYMFDLNIPFGS